MDDKKRAAIQRYREATRGLSGEELHNAVNSFRSGDSTQDLYPHKTK